jgi:hypothetical protein
MPRWARLLLDLPPIALAVSVLVLIAETVAPRLSYPYDLEWMEGGMLVHVWRLREGLPLYAPPTGDWVPYIYPPLYPWLLSLVGEPSYNSARVLSLLAALACGLAAMAAVRREGASWGLAAAAGAGFLACYETTGAFFDLARNDTLALALATWGLVACRRGTRAGVVAGGLLLAAAFTAKHNYALLGLPMVLWLYRLRGRRRALAFVAASAAPALMWTVWMDLSTDGAFLTYLLKVPGSHPLVGKRGWPLVEKELWGALAMLNAGALVAAVTLLRERSLAWAVGVVAVVFLGVGWLGSQMPPVRSAVLSALPAGALLWGPLLLVVLAAGGLLGTFWRRERPETATWWGGMLVILVPLTILMRAHHGGFVNVLMPGIWILAVCGALGLQALGRRHWVLAVLAMVLACGPMFQQRWDPTRFQPTAADVAAMDRLREEIAAIEGPVLVPHAAWLPHQAGKAPSFPLIAFWDVDHFRGPYKDRVVAIDEALAQHRWAAIFTSGKSLGHGMEDAYKKTRKIKLQGKAGMQKTGWKVRPQWIWLPRLALEAQEPTDTTDP